ncbi:hypothetical protein [Salinicola aestuarinus]|uniref:hypothetical protein n=1 Tax=Salinicola aestuarinus TaxID=1949082 RepID=UPI00130072BC|nr:hypothetical protein [Salinicola aestuarinus]
MDELLEVEIEWRIDYRHLNLGFHKGSTISGLGEGRGEMTGQVDHVGEAAEHYRYACRHRHMARALLAHVTERQRMALLLAAYAIPEQRWALALDDDRQRIEAIKQGHRGLTLGQVCDAQQLILLRLGWSAFAGWNVPQPDLRAARWSLAPVFSGARQRRRFAMLPQYGRQVFKTRKALERSAEKARAALLYMVGEQSKIAA